MDSVALAAHLAAEWAEVIAESGIAPAYVVSVVEEVYAADTTLDDAWAKPLADYYLLRRAVRAFSPEFDISPKSGGSYRLSQRYSQLKAMLDEAAAKVERIVNAGTSTRGRVVTVVADYLTGSSEA